MKAKAWYQSKTVIVNILMALAATLAFVTGDQFPVELGPEITRWVVLGMGLVNIALRFVTTSAIKLSRG